MRCLLLLVLCATAMTADLPPELAAKMEAARAAAAAATPVTATKAPTRVRAPAAPSRARALGTSGPLAISGVAIASPADPTAVPRFGRIELLVAIPTLAATRPYDPDPATGGLDLRATFHGPGGTYVVPGYFDGEDWRVRFAPQATGAWSFSVSASDSSGSAAWSGGAFTCVASSNPGFLRPNGSALTFSGSGRHFVGIGHNTGWMMMVEHPALSGPTMPTAAYGPVPATAGSSAEGSMAANGENLLSFWLSAPWESPTGPYAHRAPIQATTTGIDHYNEAPCKYLDDLLTRAEAAGIYLLPAIWPHDALRGSQSPWGAAAWSNNAYSSLCTARDFVTTVATGGGDTAQWAAQKKFYRYLIARFGASTALAGWVGAVEIDGTDAWAVNQAQVLPWCGAVRSYFAANDPYRTSDGRHPLVFHRTDGTGSSAVAFDPADIRAVDSYGASGSNLGVGFRIGNQTITMAGNGKPRFHTEFGGNVLSGASQPLHLHNGLWGGIAAGATISPLLWTDGQSYPRLTDGPAGAAMQNHLRWISQFVAGTPWAGHPNLVSQQIFPGTLSSPPALGAFYSRLSDRGFGWIHRTSGAALGNPSVPLTVTAGSYQVWWFDTHADCSTPTATTLVNTATSTLSLAIPAVLQDRTDVAWRYQRRPSASDGFQTLTGGVPQVITVGTSGGGIWTSTITSLPSHVALYHTSDGVTLGEPITSVPVTLTGTSLRVIGIANNLTTYDSFQFITNEGAVSSDPATMTLSITAAPTVNHAPVFAKGADQVVLEDCGPRTLAGWATGISSGAGDPAQALTFLVFNDQPALFSAQPAVSADGTLTFTPAFNAYGTATLWISLHDDGGTANGGSDVSEPQTFTISITPVNDAPAFLTTGDITVREDPFPSTPIEWLSAWSPDGVFHSGPPGSSEADQLDWQITVADPSMFSEPPSLDMSGRLHFVLAWDAFGSTTMTVRLHDDGGTANGGVDLSEPQTITITVTPVNDQPSFVPAPGIIAALEDDPATSIPGWASAISAGNGEGAQTLAFLVTNDNPALFSVAPAITTDGTLSFTPAPDAWGATFLTIVLADDGGTADGGLDQSLPITVPLYVLGINDAPTFIPGGNLDAVSGSPPVIVPAWATGITPGPGESAQQLSFQVVTNRPDLFASWPLVAASGDLIFTPAAGVAGVATVTVSLHDDGGTANGGVDASAPHSFTITVNATTPTDHPPTLSGPAALTTAEDTPLIVTVLAADADGDALSLVVTAAPQHGTLSASAGGFFTYAPAPDYAGGDAFTLVAEANGATSAPLTVALTVTPVNDPPTLAPASLIAWSGRATTLTLGANDIESSPLVWTIGTPAHGGVSGTAPNLTYTPVAGYSGADAFPVTVSDGVASSSITVQIQVLFAARINFQPAASAVPAGYVADAGAVFAARGNGLSYGWNKTTNETRDRNLVSDQRYDTLNHLQKSSNSSARWEIAVPNGSYLVTLVAGDAAAYDSRFRLAVEGVLLVNGNPTSAQRWVSGTGTVLVSDGRLTVTSATGAQNNKVCFIDLERIPATPVAGN